MTVSIGTPVRYQDHDGRGQPVPAIILRVRDYSTVDLLVWDHDLGQFAETLSVRHAPPGSILTTRHWHHLDEE
jgi:hypothetical protein